MRTDASSGTFGISRDITERRRMQDALALRTRQLETEERADRGGTPHGQRTADGDVAARVPVILNNGRAAGESALEFFQLLSSDGSVSGDFFTVTALSEHEGGRLHLRRDGSRCPRGAGDGDDALAGAGPERHDA